MKLIKMGEFGWVLRDGEVHLLWISDAKYLARKSTDDLYDQLEAFLALADVTSGVPDYEAVFVGLRGWRQSGQGVFKKNKLFPEDGGYLLMSRSYKLPRSAGASKKKWWQFWR